MSVEARTMRWWLGVVLALACTGQYRAQPLWQQSAERSAALRLTKLGDSAAKIDKKIGRLFEVVLTNRYLPRHPFRELLTYTNQAVVSEWRSKQVEEGKWPDILFAVFSDERKTNLVDALVFEDQHIRPLVDGLYNHQLMAIKAGDSVTKLYSQVGRRDGEYFIAKDGKWQVRFSYWGHAGRFVQIDADAATGLIVEVIVAEL